MNYDKVESEIDNILDAVAEIAYQGEMTDDGMPDRAKKLLSDIENKAHELMGIIEEVRNEDT